MAVKLSVGVRNARLNTIESTIGTAPKLQIRTGAPPTNITDADSGTLLAEITLPSDWMAAAASGAKAKSGTWEVAASGTGTAGHFRLKDNASPVVTHIQGTVTATGGGGDLTLNNTSINSGQTVTVSTFTLTDGNA